MAKTRRFVVRHEAIAGQRIRFDREEAHHLGRVLRLRPGALLEAVDGAGRLYAVRLDTLGHDGASGTILREGTPARESPCAITLAQAILKGDRMTWLVQKATELGVARIVPLLTTRVVARATGERVGGRAERWARVAREAMKQCGRTVAPTLDLPRPFPDIVAEVCRFDAAWLLGEGGRAPLAHAGETARPRRLLLLVGPEGGFTRAEIARGQAAGTRLVGLGPRTLRAESAGLVAVTLCQHLFGDLGTHAQPETDDAQA
ncbi:MAG: 16S rRNA (uracil(1498)-N(3))-methyltransferase [Candidatus Rokuibacteriota bacterium]